MNNLKTRMTTSGVLIIEIDVPNCDENILNEELSNEFKILFDSLYTKLNVDKWHGTVIKSRKLGSFIAGADINWIKSITDPLKAVDLSVMGQKAFLEIEKSERPVVAAILGSCMGGGLELALACHYRISVDHEKTQFSLPEVKLGLLPGSGGTQRAPKIMGVVDAVDFMLTGKSVDCKKAKELGLIDFVIEKIEGVEESLEQLDWELERKAVETVLAMRINVLKISRENRWIDYFLSFHNIWKIYEKKVILDIEKKTNGNYPAPFKIFEAIKEGHLYGRKRGYREEAKNFGILVISKESKALINVFNLMKDMKKQLKLIPPNFRYMKIALYGGKRSHLETNNELNDVDIIIIMPENYCTDVNVLVQEIMEMLGKNTKIPILIDVITFPENISYPNLFLTRFIEPYDKSLHVEIVKQDDSLADSVKTAVYFLNIINKCVTITRKSHNNIPGFVNNCILALAQYIECMIKSVKTFEILEEKLNKFGFSVNILEMLDSFGLYNIIQLEILSKEERKLEIIQQIKLNVIGKLFLLPKVTSLFKIMVKFEALTLLLISNQAFSWFLCPSQNACASMPIPSPCCNQQQYVPPNPCCNQQPPLATGCGGCGSRNVNYQPQLYPQPMLSSQPQQYQVPAAIPYPQVQNRYPILNKEPLPQQTYIQPSNSYIQPDSYVTPNPCYLVGKHRCCNQKLQNEMETFITDYQNNGASMCNYNRLAKEMQNRLQKNFNSTFETIVSLGNFEHKSYYDGFKTCKFEKRGKTYLAYETPFENPSDMPIALAKDLGLPIGGQGFGDQRLGGNGIGARPYNSFRNNVGLNQNNNFEFGNTNTMNQIIRLNVGGKRFDTYLRTLLIDKNFIYYEAFKSLLDDNCAAELPMDTDGNFFIDEDPEEFSEKLKSLRLLVAKENGNTFELKNLPTADDEKPPKSKKRHSLLFWKS
uniref:enoyl-CoA hydratase n=1 Tax=Parastrongyloides trichosuri TaxID=131310 RepID=A0A0N4ZTL5_PARTI